MERSIKINTKYKDQSWKGERHTQIIAYTWETFGLYKKKMRYAA